MGTFSTAVFIRNGKQMTKEEFAEEFCKSMEKRGYKRGTEKSGSSYVLVFSENSDWVTLKRKSYESDRNAVTEDSGGFAEGLQTACVSISLVDSDFATLELYNRIKERTDFAVLGDASGYWGDEEPPRGLKKCWEQFLKEGVTWEQFQKVLTDCHTFAEDGLDEMAPYLGMDMGCMGSDELSSGENESDTIVLYFRKAARMPSLNTVFKQVFGEGLKEKGFVKIKGKQPYLVRMAGDEIIHIVTCMDEWCGDRKCKEFSIYASAATVYRSEIDLTKKPEDISFLFHDLDYFYIMTNPENYDAAYRKQILSFRYEKDNENSLRCAMEQALGECRKIMLPVLGQAVTLESCLEFFWKYDLTHFGAPEYDEVQQTFSPTVYEDGLLLIQMDHHDDFMEKFQKKLERDYAAIEKGELTWSREQARENNEAYRLEIVTHRDRIYNNPELYKKALEGLGKRKKKNQETLRSYGLL